MNRPFRVVFSGSCLLAIREKGDAARVLLPHGREGWQASDGRTLVRGHHAFVHFPLNTLADGRQPDLQYTRFERPADGGSGQLVPYGIVILEQETLRLPRFLGSKKLLIDDVPTMTKACVNAELQDRFLAADPFELPDSGLAALVDLDLNASTLRGECRLDSFSVFDPAPENSPIQIATPFANKVVLNTLVDDGVLEIRTGKDPLRFKKGSKMLTIGIANEAIDDVLFPRLNYARNRDFDFELLFWLTKAAKTDLHVPIDVDPYTGQHRGVKKDCHLAKLEKVPFQQ